MDDIFTCPDGKADGLINYSQKNTLISVAGLSSNVLKKARLCDWMARYLSPRKSSCLEIS